MPGCAGSSSKRPRLRAAWALALALWPGVAGAGSVGERLLLLRQEDLRVARVFLRLVEAATPDCRARGPQAGMVLHDLAQYAPEARPEAARLFGLRERVAVMAVVERGPAAQAGVMPGDALVAVNDLPLPASGADGVQRDDGVSLVAGRIERALGGGEAILTVERGGAPVRLRLAPMVACAARAELVPSTRLNAHAGSEAITVTTALVEFAGSDDELAFLLGHELGHVALGHNEDEALGLSGVARRSVESAADRFGLHAAARAGYDPRAAAEIVARLAAARDQRRRIDPAHPSLPARIAMLRSWAAEERGRMRDGNLD